MLVECPCSPTKDVPAYNMSGEVYATFSSHPQSTFLLEEPVVVSSCRYIPGFSFFLLFFSFINGYGIQN